MRMGKTGIEQLFHYETRCKVSTPGFLLDLHKNAHTDKYQFPKQDWEDQQQINKNAHTWSCTSLHKLRFLLSSRSMNYYLRNQWKCWNTPYVTIWRKVKKTILDPPCDLGPQQTVMGSSLGHAPPLRLNNMEMVWVLFKLLCWQTHKCRWKYQLIGRGNKFNRLKWGWCEQREAAVRTESLK